MRLCTCGARASVRFSRPAQNGKMIREDRCSTCAEILEEHHRTVAWTQEPITDDLLAEHAREDARARRGDAETDMLLMTFGSDY